MTAQELQSVIALIEGNVSRSDAVAKLAGMGEVVMYANRAGYLLLAAEFLKCALGSSSMGALNDIFSKDSEFAIDFLATSEEEFRQILR